MANNEDGMQNESIDINVVIFFFFFCGNSVLSRTLFISNVPSHVRFEELERFLTPLGTLQKCEKVTGGSGGGGGGGGGSGSGGRRESSPVSDGRYQTIEVVYETPEEAEK